MIVRWIEGFVLSLSELLTLTVFKKLSLDRSNLISTYGDTTVTLSSANSYSYEKVKISFSQYCEDYTGPQNLQTLGNGLTGCSL